MKNKPVEFVGRWALLVLSLLTACDPFQEDFIRKENQFILDAGSTDYYVVANTPVVIDLKTMVSSLFSDVTMKVSEGPTRGTLTTLNQFLLKYTPSAPFVEGKDEFDVVFTSDGKFATKTVTVHMNTDATAFPCALYAVRDHAYAVPGKSISIKAMNNDRLCGIEGATVQLSISIPPEHGQAIIKGDAIIYVPEAGFEGEDEMVYQINGGDNQRVSGADTVMASYGLVNIFISDNPCPFFILDTYTLDLTDDTEDLPSKGGCPGGYDIPVWGIVTPPCDRYGYFIKQISQSNHSGTVCFGPDGGFAYIPDPSRTPGNDRAEFEVCVNGECRTVTIYVIRE